MKPSPAPLPKGPAAKRAASPEPVLTGARGQTGGSSSCLLRMTLLPRGERAERSTAWRALRREGRRASGRNTTDPAIRVVGRRAYTETRNRHRQPLSSPMCYGPAQKICLGAMARYTNG